MDASDKSYAVIGAFMEVYNTLGCGFLEAVYQDALEIEFGLRNIPFIREAKLNVDYKGHVLNKYYFADFICFDNIIVEAKAIDKLSSIHTAQVLNYLHATGCELGLLVNFGSEQLDWKRVINSHK